MMGLILQSSIQSIKNVYSSYRSQTDEKPPCKLSIVFQHSDCYVLYMTMVLAHNSLFQEKKKLASTFTAAALKLGSGLLVYWLLGRVTSRLAKVHSPEFAWFPSVTSPLVSSLLNLLCLLHKNTCFQSCENSRTSVYGLRYR
jgi:hypothetical protein